MRPTPGQIVHIPPLKRSPEKNSSSILLNFLYKPFGELCMMVSKSLINQFREKFSNLVFLFWLYLISLSYSYCQRGTKTQLRLTEDYIGVRGHIFQLLQISISYSGYKFTVQLHSQSSNYHYCFADTHW